MNMLEKTTHSEKVDEKLENADKIMRLLGRITRGEQDMTMFESSFSEIISGWERINEEVKSVTIEAFPEINQILAKDNLKKLFDKDYPRYASGLFK